MGAGLFFYNDNEHAKQIHFVKQCVYVYKSSAKNL